MALFLYYKSSSSPQLISIPTSSIDSATTIESLLQQRSTNSAINGCFLHLDGIPFKNGRQVFDIERINGILTNSIRQFESEKEPFFKSWEGYWSFSILLRNKLILARDKFGNKTIYYYNHPKYFVYSTSLSALLKLPFIPKELNHNAMIQLRKGYRRDNQTFYLGIHQLPKGYYLSVDNKQVNLTNYWRPEKNTQLLYAKEEDYIEHFNEIYHRAVSESLVGFNHPGIALSNGLDSSSMFALASSILEPQQTLNTITWKPNVVDKSMMLNDRIYDESPLVEKFTRNYKNVKRHIVTSEYGNILGFYKKIINVCHQPIINLQPHIMEVFEKGKEIDVDIMLNGIGGNFTVSHGGKRTYRLKSITDILLIAKLGFEKIQFSWKNISSRFKKIQNLSQTYIRKDAILDYESKYYTLSSYRRDKSEKEDTRYTQIINLHQLSLLQDISTYTSHLGFESRVPVLDARIVDFCLSVPNEVFNLNGVNKKLIKMAMKDKLPKDILHNRKRGLQGVNYVSKFKYEEKQFRSILASFANSPLVSYWLDVELIRQHFYAYISIYNSKPLMDFQKANFNIINRGVQVGLFLLKIENGKI